MSANLGNDPEFNHTIPKLSAGRRFTLLKVLAVLGILAVLIALLLPATRSARPAAYRYQCANNLEQIAMALHGYEQAHKAFPPAHTVDANGRPLHSWRALILPYLEQQPLYQSIGLSKPWNDPTNAQAIETSACLVDGHVQFLKASTPATVRQALMSIAGDDNKFAIEW